MRRANIVVYAESLIGVKYAHQGRLSEGGKLDCLGLICAVGDHFDIDYEDMKGYSRNPNPKLFREHFRRFTDRGDIGNIRDGSIGIFRQGGMPSHLAIFCTKPGGERGIIHALLPARQVVRHTWGEPYKKLLVEVREFPGVED